MRAAKLHAVKAMELPGKKAREAKGEGEGGENREGGTPPPATASFGSSVCLVGRDQDRH